MDGDVAPARAKPLGRPNSPASWLAPARWPAQCALVVLTFIAFAPALSAGFVDWDDQALLIDNDRWRGLGAEHLRWMFTSTLLGHYQPLTWVSYGVDHALWGMEPGGYHFTSLAIHAANSVLVYLLALRLIASARGAPASGRWARAAAFAGAAFWALHPLRVESVVWVTERRDVLSTLFLLCAMLAYLRAFPARAVRPASWGWYASSAGLLALSLLSKPWGMSFFVIAIILDWWPLRRLTTWPDARAALVQKVPYIALGLASALATRTALHAEPGAMRTLGQWGPVERALQAIYGLAFYPLRTVWPAGLSPLYELPVHLDWREPRMISAFGVIAVGLVAVWVYGRRWPGLLAAAMCYLVLIGPVLGFVQAGNQLVADRYSYVACLGWSILAGAAVVRGVARLRARRRALVLSAIGASVCALMAVTWRQASVWHDSLSLWARAVRVTPSAATLVNYGLTLERAGRGQEAIEPFIRAVEYDPRDGRAYFVLANAQKQRGDLEFAEFAYRRAAEFMPQAYQAWVNLGTMLKRQGRDAEALEAFRAAVRDVETTRAGVYANRPLSGVPYLALGSALRDSGDAAGARAAFEKARGFEDSKAIAEERLRGLRK